MRLAAMVLILAAAVPSALCAAPDPVPEVVLYTYDSFVAKGGLGSQIFPLFEKKCGCRVRALPSGDGAQVVNRLRLDTERGKRVADVVIGIDQSTWERAKPYIKNWGGWVPKGYRRLPAETRVAEGFLPFDYGVFAFMGDRKALEKSKLSPPTRLQDLLETRWRRNFILQDPRTSTPGLAFLLYTRKILGEGWRAYWAQLRHQWLLLAPGWDQAYGLFLKGEAPLVWSYTTSQAYHEEHGDRSDHERRYHAILFVEGQSFQPLQVEGAALVQDSKLARAFLEFLISPEVQERVPRHQWMLPVLTDVALPRSFSIIPHPKKRQAEWQKADETEKLLKEWEVIVQKGGA